MQVATFRIVLCGVKCICILPIHRMQWVVGLDLVRKRPIDLGGVKKSFRPQANPFVYPGLSIGWRSPITRMRWGWLPKLLLAIRN